MSDIEKKDDNWIPQSYPIPTHWVYTELETVFENLPLTGKKLAQKDYDTAGKIPVIDQGVSEIGGYSNYQEKVVTPERPVIIFGDHTKCLKYIPYPFIPGADGIKVLLPSLGVDPKFAFYACTSLRLPDRGYSRHFSFLKKCDFPLPPLNEQKRIVAKIEELFSELDNGITALKIAREQLKVYRQSVLKHAFEGKLTAKWREENADKLESPEQLLARIQQEREARYQEQLEDWKAAVKEWETNSEKLKKPKKPKNVVSAKILTKSEVQEFCSLPKGWALLNLGSFINRVDAGKSFKCDEREPNQNEIGVAKVSAVSWGEYNESESKTCIDLEKINPDFFINSGDFIFSRANTIELVGSCVIAKKVNKNIMLSDKTLRLKFNKVNEEYVLQYLRSHYGRNEITKRSTGNQESMRNIGQDKIKSIVLPVCSTKEMEKVVKIVNEILEPAIALSNEIEMQLLRAKTLRQSILKKAFSGQLVPQDPSDEPASKLLARIQAEKEFVNTQKTSKSNKRHSVPSH